MAAPAISVQGLTKHDGDLVAVQDVSFEVPQGQVFALLGPNGAGKTTTVEILEGFRKGDNGEVRVLGFDPSARRTARDFHHRLVLVQRRENGQLKRLRLSPLPVAAFLGGLILNVLVICAVQIAALLALGHFAYHDQLATNWAALPIAIVVGVVCFVSVGVGVSALVPNQESGAPIINLVFFVLVAISGIWFPIAGTSGLAKFAAYLPIRHFVLAVFAAFDHSPGASPWAWPDLRVLVIWAAIGILLAVRRFSFEPRRR
ncbi:MAG TPA: ABC transporter permease [Acidimicrobiales bacterium]|nr:ABC transporter permease [Acidimicrobiales bacterium]